MADRMGQVELAIQSLEQAYGPWREDASLGLKCRSRDEGLRELQVAVNLEPSLDQERRFLDAQFGRDARQGPTPFSVR
jgi:hypothetical protein